MAHYNIKPKHEDTSPHIFMDAMNIAMRWTLALVLIGTGGIFFLDAAGTDMVSTGGPWWVIYLVAAGIAACIGAFVAYREAEHVNAVVIAFGVFGVLLFILSLIFLADPTWSFTQGWNFTLFSNINWNLIWPIAVILLGFVVLFSNLRRK